MTMINFRRYAFLEQYGKEMLRGVYLIIFLFTLLLSACAPATAASTQSSTEAPTAMPTVAAPVTPHPTEAPTAVPTPAEAGPKVGDQVTENGFTYTITEIRSPQTNEVIYTAPFRPVGQILSLPYPNDVEPDGKGGYVPAQGNNDLGPIRLFVEQGVDGEQAIKKFINQPYSNKNDSRYYDYIVDGLIKRAGISIFDSDKTNKFGYERLAGNMILDFSYNGNAYTAPFNQQSGATVYIL